MSQYTGTELTLVRGDKVIIDFIVKDIDGVIQDVTDFTPTFKYKKYGDTGSALYFNGTVVTPGTNGRIRFTFDLSTWTAGDYDCEIQLLSISEEITCPDIIVHVQEEL